MREAVFLQRNRDRWRAYQQTPPADPDELAARFVALTDDLAYARTFFPEAPFTRELNQLAGTFHQKLYRNRRESVGRLRHFWAVELPLTVARHHRVLAFTLAFFLGAVGLGALSAAYDDTFVRLILGDSYVNMTLANIRRGEPMAVYATGEPVEMFIQITLNNVIVALRTFALGALAGLGTAAALFYNGVMLGAFQLFFWQHGVLGASLLAVWLHGTLEISSIVLAGAAGFIVGRGVLLPGSYPRGVAFRQAARAGLKLAVGVVPVLFLAGFFESFLTRYANSLPVAVPLFIIGTSAAFIGWYFVWYPRRVKARVEGAA